MPPKAFRRRQQPSGVSSAAPSPPPQAAPPARNAAIHSASFDEELQKHRRVFRSNPAYPHVQERTLALFASMVSPIVYSTLNAERMREIHQLTAPSPPKAATPPPAPIAVASPSPSPALSYASLESSILKRPRSPGSSSSGSSRAASIMEVDNSGEFGSRAPTPTPSTRRQDVPSVSPPSVADVASLLPPPRADIASPDAISPSAAAARPATPSPHVDTPMLHGLSQPQPPATIQPGPSVDPEQMEQWNGFLENLDIAIRQVSECPAPLTARFHDLVVKLQLATTRVKAPPKKKVRIAPPSPSAPKNAPAPPPAPTPASAPAATGAPGPKKPVAAPPALSVRPDPKAAPPVSVKTTRKRRQGKHTAHGASRRGIILTPPARANINAGFFTPEVINILNNHLEKDLKSEVILTHAIDGHGIFLAATRVPTSAETAFVLKHVRRLFPSPVAGVTINSTTATSTSFLRIIDVPILSPEPMTKDWVTPTRAAFLAALKVSPVGSALADVIKHQVRIMRTSAHSDSCVAWVDISDTVSGANSKRFVDKFISVGGVNCRIAGARPHSGSVFCTRCSRWGHHSSQCRRLGVRCPLCGGPHSEANHSSMVDAKRVDQRSCVNCVASKRAKHAHSATDRAACPFWKNRFDRAWLKRQFKAPV